MTFSFLGRPMPDHIARGLVDGLTVRDDTSGQSAVRQRTERLVPLRCSCGHHERQHGADRRGRPICWGSTTCACDTYRPETTR